MIRYLTAGESHGPELTGIVEGVPSGVEITSDYLSKHLMRRQEGYGRGGRMAFEKDVVTIKSGVRFNKAMGSPISLHLKNKAWEKDAANWPVTMAISGDNPGVEKITLPRPGHADLVGVQKYNFDDVRPVIERSSARETAIRVACCGVARQFLEALGIQIGGHVIRIGANGYNSWDEIREISDPLIQKGAINLYETADESEVRCLDSELTKKMVDEIKQRRKEGSSLGGVYEIIVTGLPAGLGSYVHWDRKLDGQIAQAIVSIQAMKGVQIGIGFEAGARAGHEVHDAIIKHPTNTNGYSRLTNRAGGLEGGVTTGMPLIVQGVMKPIPTMLNPIGTIDIASGEATATRYERSDVCALPRAVVVAESVIALVLANALLEKFGGDSISEIKDRFYVGS